jgi:hypothetical protein
MRPWFSVCTSIEPPAAGRRHRPDVGLHVARRGRIRDRDLDHVAGVVAEAHLGLPSIVSSRIWSGTSARKSTTISPLDTFEKST